MSGPPQSPGSPGEFPPSPPSGSPRELSTPTSGSSSGNNAGSLDPKPRSRQQELNKTFRIGSSSGQNLPEAGSSDMSMMKKEKSSECTNPDMYHNVFQNTTDGLSAKDPFKDKMENQKEEKALKVLNLPQHFTHFMCKSTEGKKYIEELLKRKYNLQFKNCIFIYGTTLKVMVAENVDVKEFCQKICLNLFVIPPEDPLCEIFKSDIGRRVFKELRKKHGKLEMCEENAPYCVGTSDIENDVKKSIRQSLLSLTKSEQIIVPSKDAWQFCKQHMKYNLEGKGISMKHQQNPESCDPWVIEIDGPFRDVSSLKSKLISDLDKIETKVVPLDPEFANYQQFQDPSFLKKLCENQRCVVEFKTAEVGQRKPWKKWIKKDKDRHKFTYEVSYEKFLPAADEVHVLLCLEEQEKGGARRKTYNDKFFYPLDEPSRFGSYLIYVPISSDGKKKDRFSQCLKALFVSEELMNIEKLVVSCHLLSEKEIVYCTKVICHEIDDIQSVSAANVNFRECRFYEERPEMFHILIDIFDDYLQEDIEVLQWRGRAIDVQVRKGQLACLEDCDVLVNSTSTNLVLGEGAVSKSLVKVAGDEIEKECKKYYKKGIQPGEIAITKGYKLKCKLVFHGAINKFSVEEKCKSLKDLLWTCLRKADEMKMHSIAFPAIGTGNLGYRRNEVAKIMFDIVEEYKQRIPNGSLQRVCFVIFEEDIDSLREFQSLEKKYWKEKTTENPKLLVTADDSDVLQKVCQRIVDAITPAAVCEPPGNEISQKERLGLSSKEKIQSDSSSEVKTTELYRRHSEQSSDCSTSDLTKKEKCCLLVQRNLQGSIRSTDTKLRKEDLEKDFYEYSLENVVCPFDGERQALLQFLTPQDCDRCKIDASLTRLYVFYTFPEQAVNDLKAVLHSKMTKFLRDNNISAKDVKQHSGVEVDHSHGSSMVLKGNIMEIKAAYEYLSALLAASKSKKQLEPCQSGTMKQNSLMERGSEDSLTTTIKETPGRKSSSAQEFPRIHQTPDGGASVPNTPFGQNLNPQAQPDILSKSQSLLNPNTSVFKSLKSIDCDIGTKKSIPSKNTKTCTSDDYVMLKHFHQHVLADTTEKWNRHKTSVELTFTDEDIVVEVDEMFKDMLKLERDHVSYPSTCDAVEKYVESRSGDDILCFETQFDGESHIAVVGKERSTVQQVCNDLKQLLDPQRSSFKGRTRSGISKSGLESMHKERKPIFTTDEDIKVFIYKETILKANADAVVCPVSKNFDIQSGLSKVIAEKAGWEFKQDCKKLLQEKGSALPVGFAHAMNPGNLKEFKAIINVVSCNWAKYMQDECKHNLTTMLMHVLYVAETQKLKSVALPAICSGRAGFPKDICAELYASCVVEYSKKARNSECTVKEVHFVDTDDEMLVVMESVFANPSAFQDFVFQKSKMLPSKSCTPEILIYKEKEGKYMINQNIVIYLFNTESTEVKSDALVCTTDESLEETPIMKVLEKAGKKFKETFKKFGKQHPSEIGIVKVTDPPHHMMSLYDHIMYTNTPKWSSQKSNLTEKYFKDLSLMYSGIFETAVKEKINSIAMPVYGPLKDHQWLVKKSIICLLDELVKFSLKKWDGSKSFAVSIASNKRDVHSLVLEGLQDLIDRGPNGFQHLTKQPNLYGDQPWGTISETEEMQGLRGYIDFRTIVLSIAFPDVVQTKHSHPSFDVKVYLPKTTKGEKVAGLLKEAFERKILFTLKSYKNEHSVAYTDIPLKTSKHGKYGYPDEKYLNKVLEILKRKLGQ